MHRSSALQALLVVALFSAGCAGSAVTPVSPSSPGSEVTAGQLAGTWSLLSLQPTSQAEQPAPVGVRYALTFADGRVSARADCNTCNGAAVLAGDTLTAGPALACTKAACPTMGFESVYTSLLSGDSAVTLSDGALVLSSARGVLRFAR